MLKISTLTLGVGLLLAHPLMSSTAWAGCDFEHPRKAKLYQADLVQAFVSCGNPGGNIPNTTSASGVPGCTPPETFNQKDGAPVNGWQWNEQRSSGRIEFRETQGDLGPNTRNLKVKLRLRRILDGEGRPANGTGTLYTTARTTMEDTVVTAPGMGTDMMIVDFPAPFSFAMINGNASLTVPPHFCLFNDCGFGLPGCTSIEIQDVRILDPNGNPFAVPGVFFRDLPN